jgi:hypothetical protein
MKHMQLTNLSDHPVGPASAKTGIAVKMAAITLTTVLACQMPQALGGDGR